MLRLWAVNRLRHGHSATDGWKNFPVRLPQIVVLGMAGKGGKIRVIMRPFNGNLPQERCELEGSRLRKLSPHIDWRVRQELNSVRIGMKPKDKHWAQLPQCDSSFALEAS
jgi:hypothetical protein